MKYRLKDQMLQLHLDFMTGGEFSARLSEQAYLAKRSRKDFDLPRMLTFDFGELMNDDDECPYRRFLINIRRDEIEEYEE